MEDTIRIKKLKIIFVFLFVLTTEATMSIDLSFIRDDHTRSMVSNGHAAVSQLELWGWLKTFNPKDGFMFTPHENIDKITEAMNSLPNPPGHSGSSFGITMRHLEFIAKHGMEKYKQEIIKSRTN